MLRRILLAAVVAAAVGFATFWWVTTPAAVPSNLPSYAPHIANGVTAFNAGGCSACHAVPGQPDRLRLGGGLAIPSPFGTFYAPNISPDPAYAHARIEDVRDLFAYLKTLSPVSGKARDHDVPFPFNVRRNLGIWKLLFMDGKPFVPDAARSARWNRGAYLVNSLGHCAECHSPRNFLGGIVVAQRFAGGPNPEGEGWVPNITQKGLGEWSENDIGYFLETGELPDGDKTAGSMRPVIRNTSQLSPEDRAAMAEYLKSLPPVQGPSPPENAPKHEHKS